jgi:hypothetical protein
MSGATNLMTLAWPSHDRDPDVDARAVLQTWWPWYDRCMTVTLALMREWCYKPDNPGMTVAWPWPDDDNARVVLKTWWPWQKLRMTVTWWPWHDLCMTVTPDNEARVVLRVGRANPHGHIPLRQHSVGCLKKWDPGKIIEHTVCIQYRTRYKSVS